MILNSLVLENIRSYSHEEVEFPRGITLFEGDIGSGKSSILMAIEFALFGLGSQKAESLLAKKADDGYATLEFTVDDQKYEIKRALKRKSTGVSQDAKNCHIKTNDEKEPLAPSELKQRILQILKFNEPGDARSESRIFRYAVFTPQEEMKKVLGDAKARLETIRRAFRIEDYAIASTNAKDIAASIKLQMKYLEGRFSDTAQLKEENKVSGDLVKIISNQDYVNPYPIQKKVIPLVLEGKDVLGIAKTGSGKTASYVLPILMKLQSAPGPKNRHMDALVLVPTRELAIQVLEVFQSFGTGLKKRIKAQAVYGGVSINPQMIGLQGVNVLVATPGRLIDLMESKALHLSEIQTLVLDEADKMLNLGFKEEIDKILSFLPKKRQNLLFSATLDEKIEKVNRLVLTNPEIVNVESKAEDIDQIKQVAYSVEENQKGPFLRKLIKDRNMKQVLVFTASSYKADNVANKLRKNGIEASAIHGKKSQGARNTALKEFKSGAIRVLVATDLLARGVDIELLPFVINYELPRSPKDYVHRIGRTGRADQSGEAISLIAPDDEHHFKIIQKKMKKQVDRIEL